MYISEDDPVIMPYLNKSQPAVYGTYLHQSPASGKLSVYITELRWLFNTFCSGNKQYASYAKRFGPGQPPSNLAARLRLNLFATLAVILRKKNKQIFMVLYSRQHLRSIFRNPLQTLFKQLFHFVLLDKN